MKYYTAGEMHDAELYKSARTCHERNVEWEIKANRRRMRTLWYHVCKV